MYLNSSQFISSSINDVSKMTLNVYSMIIDALLDFIIM